MTPKKRKTFCIATHDGLFHTDEVFACATLIIALRKNYPRCIIHIMRTRDFNKVPKNAFWIDLGEEDDQKKRRFDHHGDSSLARQGGLPYASFGLILLYIKRRKWLHMRICQILEDKLATPSDLIDNKGPDVFKNWKLGLYPYNIREAIMSFHPNPMEEDEKGVMDKAFMKAIKFAEEIIRREIVKAKEKIMLGKEALKAYQKTSDKRIIILPKKIPQKEFSCFPEPLIVVCPYSENNWALWLVRRKGQDFNFGNIDTVKYQSGIFPVFVHDHGHLVVVKSKKDALHMAPFLLLPSA